MAFNDQSQYPKGRVILTGLNTTPQVAFAVAAGKIKISHIEIATTAAARSVTFRAIDDSPIYMAPRIPANSTLVLPGFETDLNEGMEVLTDAAPADVTVTIFYFLP